jgi:hypothetical protein
VLQLPRDGVSAAVRIGFVRGAEAIEVPAKAGAGFFKSWGLTMTKFGKLALSGALAAALATASLTAPAQAGDRGAGLAIGLATGLIVGGLLLNAHRHHHGPSIQFYGDGGYDPGYDPAYADAGYGIDQPVCYPGPKTWRWEQVCKPDGYGGTYCAKVKHYFRQQICN